MGWFGISAQTKPRTRLVPVSKWRLFDAFDALMQLKRFNKVKTRPSLQLNYAGTGKRPFFWVSTNLRDPHFAAPVQTKCPAQAINTKKKRPQLNKLHFSTEILFLKHHVLHNDHEIALISDVVKESSSLFEKKKSWILGFGCVDVAFKGWTECSAKVKGGARMSKQDGWRLKNTAEALGLNGFRHILGNIQDLKVCFLSPVNN